MNSAKFPGGRVVAGCFIALSTTSGLGFYGLAVYLNAFSKERGWTLSSISFATTVFFVVAGIVGTIVARMISRRDARTVMIVGALIGAGALALLGQAQAPWQMYLIYVLFATGFSAAGLVPVTTVVTRWYHARRSIALSVASTGLSVGGMVLTPAAKWLTDQVGLVTATPILAAVWLVGTVPIMLWLVRADPGPLGWLPDGERAQPNTAPPALRGMHFGDAVKTRFFWCTAVGFVLMMGSQVGGLQQLVKLAEERTGPVAAAFATGVVAGMSVIARLIGGRVVTRLPMTAFTATLGAIQGLSLIWMATTHSTIPMFAAFVVFGATVGNILMLQSLLVSQRFGVRDYARIFGRLQLIVVLGTAGGPFLLGWLHDLSGSYTLAYVIAGAISIAGAATMALAGPADEHDEAPARVAAPAR